LIVAASLALLLGGVSATRADEVADFYATTQVTLVVPAGAGGGYGLYGQIMSRHIGNHIPGKPTVVVQFMAGGGGIVAANYLYNTAPKDGSVISGLFSTLPVTQALRPSGARFDATRFAWLGSVAPMVNAVGVWHEAPASSLEELRRTEVVMGATGKAADLYLYPKIMNELLGTKFKIVLGYEGSGSVLLAIENGEAHGMAMGLEPWRSTRPEWISQGKVKLIAQNGLERDPSLPGVPTLVELATSEEDKALMRFIATPAALGRVVAAPPGIPEARLAALRKAFMDTVNDPAFIKDVTERGLTVDPAPAEKILEIIRQAQATPPAVIERTKQLLDY
jgi:tripartite-type tricarboxylate transporter receptor subunit TctC